MGISHLADLCVGPMDRILVTMLISCICRFGNVCFVLSLCHISVQSLFDHPFIGTVSNALFSCAFKHFVVVELGVLFSALSSCLEKNCCVLSGYFSGFLLAAQALEAL